MMKIVCLKWGNKYSSDYVNILYSSLKRNTNIDFEFICFTEDSSDINNNITIKPLPDYDLKGWWWKLFLFSEDAGLSGDIFYIDLDTVITGNIDDILKPYDDFIVLKEFGNLLNKDNPNNPYKDKFGSGLMYWNTNIGNIIWNTFKSNKNQYVSEYRGDQGFIEYVVKNTLTYKFFQDIHPNKVRSFKYECADSLPSDTSIVCFHGTPNPHDCFEKRFFSPLYGDCEPALWVKDYWRI